MKKPLLLVSKVPQVMGIDLLHTLGLYLKNTKICRQENISGKM